MSKYKGFVIINILGDTRRIISVSKIFNTYKSAKNELKLIGNGEILNLESIDSNKLIDKIINEDFIVCLNDKLIKDIKDRIKQRKVK